MDLTVDELSKLRQLAIKALALMSNELRQVITGPSSVLSAPYSWAARVKLADLKRELLAEIGQIDAEVDRLMQTTPSRGVCSTYTTAEISDLATVCGDDAFAFVGEGWRN